MIATIDRALAERFLILVSSISPTEASVFFWRKGIAAERFFIWIPISQRGWYDDSAMKPPIETSRIVQGDFFFSYVVNRWILPEENRMEEYNVYDHNGQTGSPPRYSITPHTLRRYSGSPFHIGSGCQIIADDDGVVLAMREANG